MGYIVTMSELYGLLMQYDIHKAPAEGSEAKNAWPAPMLPNTQSPVLWVGPAEAMRPSPPEPRRQVPVAPEIAGRMAEVAAASGLDEHEAWSEAAETWIAQRQHDMLELATPDGRTLARAVQRVWTTIDEQMGELRVRSD
jgi:hypothetical protein